MSLMEEIVKLTGSENWKAWNTRFIAEATNRGLWEIINPTSTSKGANARGNTPASGTSQVVVPGGKPKNASEMTAAGRDAYKIDLSEYREEKGDYERELQNITFLCSWITKTVAANLFDTTCDPEKRIHEWYAALKERGGTNDLQEFRRAMEEWETANKTLSRKPKDMLSWLRGWELALLKAQKAKVPGTNDSIDNTVRGFGYDGWCDSYYNSNQDAIDNNKFMLQKLLKDFSERVRRSDDFKPPPSPRAPSVSQEKEPQPNSPNHKQAPLHWRINFWLSSPR
ncbi:uncharacterized protein B0T15DRAFT_488584 [Chaetomium strumarium]|uniref:Uncharacterized protein n=1 Tax=Chaetomium strumarium TaxID=1170767 RepID=A0AAJ0H1P5_9PEZI|nr:hypothetical protein B0T15DRAFT_488584 [Chaetomium strumarium]